MLSPSNTNFSPPIPDSIIVNEGLGSRISFVKGKTYRIRMISFAAFAAAMIHFDSHTMRVIMNDAAYIKQQDAYMLRISPAQRYDFLIEAVDRDSGNYPFLVALDINRDWTNSSQEQIWAHNYTGYLVMDDSLPLDRVDVVSEWKPVDDSHFKPFDGGAAYDSYDTLIELDFEFCFDENGYPRYAFFFFFAFFAFFFAFFLFLFLTNRVRSCFNNVTYIAQLVPTLYSAATTGESNTDPAIYGQVNPFIINYGDVVQIVVNNLDAATHPFHLHGHHFQVLDRPGSGAGSWPGRDVNYAATPPLRDTVTVMANSYAVLRFHATNPGVWLFHCHIEWHVEMGLTATFIEAPDRLRGLSFPDDHLEACRKMGIPYEGNAAGNTENYTDTSGFITVPPTDYNGYVFFSFLFFCFFSSLSHSPICLLARPCTTDRLTCKPTVPPTPRPRPSSSGTALRGSDWRGFHS